MALPPASADERHEETISFRSLFTSIGHDFKSLPSKQTAITLGLGGVFVLAASPADSILTRRASLSEPLDHTFEVGGPLGSGWVQAGAALGTFVIGRVTDKPRVQAVGADLVRAQVLNSVLTHGLKISIGRTRPDGARFSFPSGHSSASFATATVLQRHFGWKVGVPAYSVAAYVGASRLQENRHYASDVIFGAAIGIVAGHTVTVGRGSHRFAPSPVPLPGGAGVMLTHLP